MLKLIRKITGNKLDLFYKGIVFTALENGAAAGALAFFCLFFIALYEGSLQAPLLWWGMAGVYPVSYTHLDVYKRQLAACPAAWG